MKQSTHFVTMKSQPSPFLKTVVKSEKLPLSRTNQWHTLQSGIPMKSRASVSCAVQSCTVQLRIPLVPAMLQVCLFPQNGAAMEKQRDVPKTPAIFSTCRHGFPGVFHPISLNNHASGILCVGGPWYYQAVPLACKSPKIITCGKQKNNPLHPTT